MIAHTLLGSTIFTPACTASTAIPKNIVTAIVPMRSSVRAALSAFGSRNAGTPLAMASTPVSAAQPDENARRTKNMSANPVSPVSCAWMW